MPNAMAWLCHDYAYNSMCCCVLFGGSARGFGGREGVGNLAGWGVARFDGVMAIVIREASGLVDEQLI
jgi:hypothetical protein